MPVHPLDGAFERVNRAEEHLTELKRHLDDLRQNYLDAVPLDFDPNPPYQVYTKPPVVYPSPKPILSILLGEICYNLRSALDYLVFELARLDSGSVQDNTQFPIDDTPKQFRSSKKRRLVGVSLNHIAAIERLQPYKGIKWSEILRTLSNPDKHRMLTPHQGMWFTVDIMRAAPTPMVAIPNVRAKRSATRPDGMEVEVELVAALHVIIPVTNVSQIPIGDHIEETLEKLIPEVRDALEAFKPEFK
jgi:hypothetical protein